MLALMRDKVTLVKRDGKRIEGIQSSVQRDKIFVADGTIPIEAGDRFLRKLPSGVEECYVVEDPGFFTGVGGIPDHYQTRVRRDTPAQQGAQNLQGTQHVTYQVFGANSRINVHSRDSSVNVGTITKDNVFTELRDVLSSTVQDTHQLDILQTKLSAMEKSKGSPGFSLAYQEFIASAANHMTVLAPFLPALSQLLGN